MKEKELKTERDDLGFTAVKTISTRDIDKTRGLDEDSLETIKGE